MRLGLVVALGLLVAASAPPVQAHAVYRHRGTVALNDSIATPGAVATTDTAVICHRSTSTVRNVSTAEKRAVFAEYGIRTHAPGQYEVDHLVSLELGGSNAITNLWPQPASPKPGFHEKDVLENRLHTLVCSGAISAKAADEAIRTDWYAAYLKYGKNLLRGRRTARGRSG